MSPRIAVLVLVPELPGFRRLLRSLDRQSLVASDFEVYAADVGLGTAEAEALRQHARYRPNVQVLERPDRPWQSLVASATADLLLPVEVTDVLYPDALRRLTDAGKQADVVVGKTVVPGRRTRDWSLMTGDTLLSQVDAPVDALAVALSRTVATTVATEAEDLAGLRQAAVRSARRTATLASYPCLRSAGVEPEWQGESAAYDARAYWEGPRLLISGAEPLSAVTLRSLESGIEWPLVPGPGPRWEVDPRTAALGEELDPGRWVVDVRREGGTTQVRLRGDVPAAAVVGGRVVAVGRSGGARMVVDVGATRRNPFLGVDPPRARIVEDPSGTRLRLPLGMLHAGPAVRLPATLHIGRLPVRATLAARDGDVVLEALLSGVPGRRRLSLSVGDARPFPLGLSLVVANAGEMTLERSAEDRPKAAVSVPSVARRAGRVRLLVARLPGARAARAALRRAR